MANTYLDTLGALREENPPWDWDDQPVQLGINPDMLNDPAFSEYDLSNIRTYEQDPLLRDAITLGDRPTELDTRYNQYEAAGYTYIPGMTPYNPNKVYVDKLNELKMAVGPLAEQEKQGNINKELASTIAHEFRHNMFDDPKYQGIIQAAYNRFGGEIPYHHINELINQAADVQLMPESHIADWLADYQRKYNWQQRNWTGYPEHLSTINTTKQFHRAATNFFNKVKREKLKRPTQTNIQKQAIGMPEHLTPPPKQTYTPLPKTITPRHAPHRDRGGFSSRGKDRGRARGRGETGQIAGGHHFSRGGLIDIPLPGRSRYI